MRTCLGTESRGLTFALLAADRGRPRRAVGIAVWMLCEAKAVGVWEGSGLNSGTDMGLSCFKGFYLASITVQCSCRTRLPAPAPAQLFPAKTPLPVRIILFANPDPKNARFHFDTLTLIL